MWVTYRFCLTLRSENPSLGYGAVVAGVKSAREMESHLTKSAETVFRTLSRPRENCFGVIGTARSPERPSPPDQGAVDCGERNRRPVPHHPSGGL